MKKVILLFPLLMLLSCSTDSSEVLPDPRPVSTDFIKSINIDKTTIRFTVLSEVPQPCYKFHSSEVESSNATVSIKIYAQRTTNDPCLEMLSSIESEISLTVTSANTYLFKFWKYNDATMDTVIAIP